MKAMKGVVFVDSLGYVRLVQVFGHSFRNKCNATCYLMKTGMSENEAIDFLNKLPHEYKSVV